MFVCDILSHKNNIYITRFVRHAVHNRCDVRALFWSNRNTRIDKRDIQSNTISWWSLRGTLSPKQLKRTYIPRRIMKTAVSWRLSLYTNLHAYDYKISGIFVRALETIQMQLCASKCIAISAQHPRPLKTRSDQIINKSTGDFDRLKIPNNILAQQNAIVVRRDSRTEFYDKATDYKVGSFWLLAL